MCRFPAYEDLLKLGSDRPGALFLDIGCGVGNDVRKAIADGYPLNQIIVCDLHPGKQHTALEVPSVSI